MDECRVSPSPGTAVVKSPATGWERWRGRWTWHSRWHLRSCWAWWATRQSSLLEPGRHSRCTTCGSWPWIEHRSTARPMCRSAGDRGSGGVKNRRWLKKALQYRAGLISVVLQGPSSDRGTQLRHFKQLRLWHAPAVQFNCQKHPST